MHLKSGIVSSIISNGYKNAKIRSFNFPLFTSKSKPSQNTYIFEYIEKLKTKKSFCIKEFKNLLLSHQCSSFNDENYISLCIGLFFACNFTKFNFREHENLKATFNKIMLYKQAKKEDFQNKVNEFRDLNSQYDLNKAVEIGIFIGNNAKDFESAMRYCLYIGINSEIPCVLAAYILHTKNRHPSPEYISQSLAKL